MLLIGPALYMHLGGKNAALEEAVSYSTIIFGGALSVLLCNILANIWRGTVIWWSRPLR
jgi:hypothetical protein